jgi:hypothetical protein
MKDLISYVFFWSNLEWLFYEQKEGYRISLTFFFFFCFVLFRKMDGKPILSNKGWRKGTLWKEVHGNSVKKGRTQLDLKSKRILRHIITLKQGTLALFIRASVRMTTLEIWNSEWDNQISFEEFLKSLKGEIMVNDHSLKRMMSQMAASLYGQQPVSFLSPVSKKIGSPPSPPSLSTPNRSSKLPRNRKGFCGSSKKSDEVISEEKSAPVPQYNISQLPLIVYQVVAPAKIRDRKQMIPFGDRGQKPRALPCKKYKNTAQIIQEYVHE